MTGQDRFRYRTFVVLPDEKFEMACRRFDLSSPLLKSAAQVVEWDDSEDGYGQTEAHRDQRFGDTAGNRRGFSGHALASQYSESADHAEHCA